jgi:hypothetical protein
VPLRRLLLTSNRLRSRHGVTSRHVASHRTGHVQLTRGTWNDYGYSRQVCKPRRDSTNQAIVAQIVITREHAP